MNNRILLAEDDFNIRNGLRDALEMEDFEVFEAADGMEAQKIYAANELDLIILDVMMPKLNGYEVCRNIRNGNKNIPIIMLTAKSEEVDKIMGLELGADDYVTKPFGLRELIARIHAVLRRSQLQEEEKSADEQFEYDALQISFGFCKGYSPGNEVELTLRELELLKYFILNPGKVIKREELLRCGWGEGYGACTRTLDQHIAVLRKKLECDLKLPRMIETVYGIGYRFM